MTELSESVKYALMNASHGIVYTGTASVYPILTTSSQAYVKSISGEGITTFEKEDGDISGTCYVGVGASGEADGTRSDTYKFVWYSSPSIVDESTDQYVSGGNSAVFMASVGWMAENPVSLQVEALTVTAGQQTFWAAMVTVILPIAVLAIGFAVWFRRRKA